MTNYIEYITIQNDRLYLIAWKCYGNPFQVGQIINSNPTLAITDFYDAGIRLLIPIMENNTTGQLPNNLPPWKQ